MQNKVVVLDTGYDNFTQEQNLLESSGFELKIFNGKKTDAKAKLEFSTDAIGIFVRWTEINDEFLKECPDLKAVVRYGAGYENIDINAATQRNIKVSNVGGYGNHSVSDHALSLIYACARGLFQGASSLHNNFGKPPFLNMFELHRKTLGIIGLGRIGGTLAKKANHLFKDVLANDPYIPDFRFSDCIVIKSSFDKVISESDVISIHCNLTKETTGLIGSKEFDKMAHHPIIVNTARGRVIETNSLLNALNSGKIHSAGLDVFNSEIPVEISKDILNHPQIITTGHYAWYSENSIEELQKRAARNMVALLNDKKIEDSLN